MKTLRLLFFLCATLPAVGAVTNGVVDTMYRVGVGSGQQLPAAFNLINSNMAALAAMHTNRTAQSWWAAGGTNVTWRMVKNTTLAGVTDVSACSWNPITKTFWTIHNNNAGRIAEWTIDGTVVRTINGTGAQCPDGEAVVWMGGNRYAISDEDNNRIFILSITNNATGSAWDSNNCQIVQLHTSIGNDPNTGSGVEGIAWDPDRNGWWVAREKTPAQLLFCSADGQTTNNYFTTAQMQTFTNATHTDFSDLYLDRENQMLWVTQDEGGSQTDRVLAISLLTSNVVYSIDTTNMGQLEGVSVTPDGLLLIAGEVNQYAIYEPVLAGLNSGVRWNPNANTNLPFTPQYPFGMAVGLAGALLTNTLYYQTNFDFSSCVAQSETNLTFTVAGALPTDLATVSWTNDNPGMLMSARASNGTVHIRLHNYSTSAIDLPSSVFKVRVDQFR